MAQTHYFPDGPRALHVGHRQRAGARRSTTATRSSSRRATSATTRSGRTPTTDVIAGLDWDRVYPLAGPIAVDGAEPGDTLAVEILDLHTRGWGWTAILPGLGLLPDDFPDPYLRIFDLSDGDLIHFREDIVIPLDAVLRARWASARRARARSRSCRPARSAATWTPASSTTGTTLYLPGPGRGRAVQLRRRARRPGRRRGLRDRPRVADVRRAALHGAEGPHDPLAAVPDAARLADAARSTTARGTARPASAATCTSPRRTRSARWSTTSRSDATACRARTPTCSASLCVDLKISEIVDAGQYVVSALLPLAVFKG